MKKYSIQPTKSAIQVFCWFQFKYYLDCDVGLTNSEVVLRKEFKIRFFDTCQTRDVERTLIANFRSVFGVGDGHGNVLRSASLDDPIENLFLDNALWFAGVEH